MQQLVKIAFMAVAASLLLAGCDGGTGYDKNPAGANAGKTFTKDDARTAQPQRRGSEGQ